MSGMYLTNLMFWFGNHEWVQPVKQGRGHSLVGPHVQQSQQPLRGTLGEVHEHEFCTSQAALQTPFTIWSSDALKEQTSASDEFARTVAMNPSPFSDSARASYPETDQPTSLNDRLQSTHPCRASVHCAWRSLH